VEILPTFGDVRLDACTSFNPNVIWELSLACAEGHMRNGGESGNDRVRAWERSGSRRSVGRTCSAVSGVGDSLPRVPEGERAESSGPLL
jgi:hypothetical protein